MAAPEEIRATAETLQTTHPKELFRAMEKPDFSE